MEEHELKHAEMEYEDQIEKEVSLEAQQAEEDGEEDEDDYEDDEDVAEYTITNPDNPEVVRRSRRDVKVKNYAQFLKDELGSDLEDEDAENAEAEEEDEVVVRETIKPVVRQEGTKVYTRRSVPDRPRPMPQPMKVEQVDHPINLDIVPLLPSLANKTFVDMKIGDKTVRVQKLMMSKSEIEAMAREGKIEMKGNTILLKSVRGATQNSSDQKSNPLANVNIDQLIDRSKALVPIPKPQTTKTYDVKRVESSAPPITLNSLTSQGEGNEEAEESYTLQLDETV